MVLHAERHVVAGLDAGRTQQLARGGWPQRRARRTSAPLRWQPWSPPACPAALSRRHRGTCPRKVPDATFPPWIRPEPWSASGALSTAIQRSSRSTSLRWPSRTSCAAALTRQRRWICSTTLAAGCSERSFEGLRHHLFDEVGFAGDSQRYDEPENSFLQLVLTRRRGLPILLATVMIEVGRRAGVRGGRHRDADALPGR